MRQREWHWIPSHKDSRASLHASEHRKTHGKASVRTKKHAFLTRESRNRQVTHAHHWLQGARVQWGSEGERGSAREEEGIKRREETRENRQTIRPPSKRSLAKSAGDHERSKKSQLHQHRQQHMQSVAAFHLAATQVTGDSSPQQQLICWIPVVIVKERER